MAIAACLSTAASAKTMHALMVGVSEYPSLDKNFQLEGPRNDVARMRDILKRRGFKPQQVSVLADGLPGASLPTRTNILAGLDHLAKTATKDDFVLLYFAGHGSQQPADRKTAEGRSETDGLFEIFLPRDVGKWSGAKGSVENALVKTELRDAVDRILATGAFVWGIFDSCHSATLVRGANPDVRLRYVSPDQLGIPQSALDEATRDSVRMRGGPAVARMPEAPISTSTERTGDGGSVFFYAAQTRETTPEMRLPLGHAEGKQYGLFGYMVTEATDTGTQMTYRQLAQYVLTRYGAMNETRVTPLFSGTDLDKPVLRQQAPIVQQWTIEQGRDLVVPAGALARLAAGTMLAVMADPLAKTDKALGYVKLAQVGLATSTAEPVAFGGKPALKADALPKGAYARVVQVAPQYALRVSVDARECGARCPPLEVVNRYRTGKDKVHGATMTWTDAPDVGDVMLKLLPDRIVLLPPSMQSADCVASPAQCQQSAVLRADPPAKDGSLGQKLGESLHAVARSTNLLRIATQLSESGQSASRLNISMKVLGKEGSQSAFSAEQVPMLRPGDRIAIGLRNSGLTPVDVTMLYVDARYGINALFPDGPGASNRLEPNASHEFEIEITNDTVGLERMLTIAVDATKGRERADFSFLAQSPLARTRSMDAQADNDDVMAFMDAAFSSYRTRAARPVPQAPSARTSMQVFTFNIVN